MSRKSENPYMMKYVYGKAESVSPAFVTVREKDTGELFSIFFNDKQDRKMSEAALMIKADMFFGYHKKADGKMYLLAIIEQESIEMAPYSRLLN